LQKYLKSGQIKNRITDLLCFGFGNPAFQQSAFSNQLSAKNVFADS
jgi:hypothetical protein